MGERSAPLVPYSVFKRQSKTAGLAATSSPVGWHLDRARSNFSTRNTRQKAPSPNAERHKTTPVQQQQEDGDINAKKQQLDHLRQIVAKLELEVARDSPSPPATTTPAHPAHPARPALHLHVAKSAATQPAFEETKRQGPTKQEEPRICVPVSRASTGGVEVPTPRPEGLDKQHDKSEALKEAIISVRTTTRKPRSGRHRRRSLEHTPGGEQRQGAQVAPLSLPVASSGGRGQQPRKHNKFRSRRSSMPSAMGFGRFV